jgi:hypothetical protein
MRRRRVAVVRCMLRDASSCCTWCAACRGSESMAGAWPVAPVRVCTINVHSLCGHSFCTHPGCGAADAAAACLATEMRGRTANKASAKAPATAAALRRISLLAPARPARTLRGADCVVAAAHERNHTPRVPTAWSGAGAPRRGRGKASRTTGVRPLHAFARQVQARPCHRCRQHEGGVGGAQRWGRPGN